MSGSVKPLLDMRASQRCEDPPACRRGRRPVPHPTLRLTTRVRPSLYDELCRTATTHRLSLSALVRELLELYTRPRA